MIFLRPSTCGPPYLRNRTSSNHNFWCTCVKRWYLQAFFLFFLKFWAVSGVNGEKIAQNEKQQLNVSCAISQGQYSIWSWFLIHLCKMMISPGTFFIVLKFSLFGVLARQKGKKLPKMENNNYIHHVPYLRNSVGYNHDFFYTSVKW